MRIENRAPNPGELAGNMASITGDSNSLAKVRQNGYQLRLSNGLTLKKHDVTRIEVHGSSAGDTIRLSFGASKPGWNNLNNRIAVFGNGGYDSISGSDFADDRHGGAGKDTIRAGGGNDRVWGDAGDDSLQVAGGDDKLDGGTGRDAFDGGAGTDRVFYYQPNEFRRHVEQTYVSPMP